jgi:hypothetical protein
MSEIGTLKSICERWRSIRELHAADCAKRTAFVMPAGNSRQPKRKTFTRCCAASPLSKRKRQRKNRSPQRISATLDAMTQIGPPAGHRRKPEPAAHCRRERHQANPTRRPGLVTGRSWVWPACVEPALCDLSGRPDPRAHDRRGFGSTDCQIPARSSPHIRRGSNKYTACSRLPPCTMGNQRRKPARTQRRRRQTQPIRQLSIFSCCFLPTLTIMHIGYTPLARMLTISHQYLPRLLGELRRHSAELLRSFARADFSTSSDSSS